MPLMVIPDEGKLILLNWMLKSDGDDFTPFELRLYANNYTPDDASTESDFQNPTFSGYLEIAIERSEFGLPFLIGHIAYTDRTPVPTFVCDNEPGETVYGWYLVTNELEPKVIAAQKFNYPRDMLPDTELKLDPFRIGLKTFVIC